jgi:DNA helicase HerA-like ATPase
MMSPRLYATFLLWLLSEMFEELPEVGDLDRPKLVFFFDEAHLLFEDAPKALVDRIEQVVRLIRSKGVGVYFVTQSPLDVPDRVLAQLGNRFQHALRVFTPREEKAVKTAADTFRPNPDFDCYTAITALGTGEALVSTLEMKGTPSMVQRTLIRPPASRLGPLTDAERTRVVAQSPVAGQYEETLDRESAYEILMKRGSQAAEAAAREKAAAEQAKLDAEEEKIRLREQREAEREAVRRERETERASRSSSRSQSVTEAAMKSVVRSVGSSVGRQVGAAIVRGILGSLLRR